MENEYIIRDEAMNLPVLPKEQRIQLDNVDEAFEEGWRQALENLAILPAADVGPVRHAHWVKRMEERKGNGYEAFTPVWRCSDCGKDYDPATCSIIKYCFECGAKMDGGKDND